MAGESQGGGGFDWGWVSGNQSDAKQEYYQRAEAWNRARVVEGINAAQRLQGAPMPEGADPFVWRGVQAWAQGYLKYAPYGQYNIPRPAGPPAPVTPPYAPPPSLPPGPAYSSPGEANYYDELLQDLGYGDWYERAEAGIDDDELLQELGYGDWYERAADYESEIGSQLVAGGPRTTPLPNPVEIGVPGRYGGRAAGVLVAIEIAKELYGIYERWRDSRKPQSKGPPRRYSRRNRPAVEIQVPEPPLPDIELPPDIRLPQPRPAPQPRTPAQPRTNAPAMPKEPPAARAPRPATSPPAYPQPIPPAPGPSGKPGWTIPPWYEIVKSSYELLERFRKERGPLTGVERALLPSVPEPDFGPALGLADAPWPAPEPNVECRVVKTRAKGEKRKRRRRRKCKC